MAQSNTTTVRPPPTTSAPTPRSVPPVHAPPPHEPDPPTHLTMAAQMTAFATDRNLIDQLRMIFQTANRHLPVPSSTVLNKALEDALDEIAKIAEKAVEAYKPPT